jgi:hypothetical protein
METTNQDTPKKRGGARQNCGRKYKYGEKTEIYQVRIPVSKLKGIKKAVKFLLIGNWLEQFLAECERNESLND